MHFTAELSIILLKLIDSNQVRVFEFFDSLSLAKISVKYTNRSLTIDSPTVKT